MKVPQPTDSKMLIFWIVLLVGVFVIFYGAPSLTVSPASMNIYEVVTHAEHGDIDHGTIQPDLAGGRDWAIITGDMTSASLKNAQGVKTAAFVAAGRLTDANAERLQKTNKFVEHPATTLMGQIIAQIIPVALIMGLLYFLFIRQLRQAGKGALNFGKSQAKLLVRGREKVVFDEVAGCDEAK